jgi:hypothetical protein
MLRADPRQHAIDLGRDVGAAVGLQDLVVEVLDAERQAGDAEGAHRLDLRLRQRPRLAFEGDLLGAVPRHDAADALDQAGELADAQQRRRAAAEIDEAQRAAGDGGRRGVQLDLAAEGRQVAVDAPAVHLGENAEVAELAPLAAERQMQVEAQLGARPRRRGERRLDPRQLGAGPERERRIVGHEEVAHLRRIGGRHQVGRGGGVVIDCRLCHDALPVSFSPRSNRAFRRASR